MNAHSDVHFFDVESAPLKLYENPCVHVSSDAHETSTFEEYAAQTNINASVIRIVFGITNKIYGYHIKINKVEEFI